MNRTTNEWFSLVIVMALSSALLIPEVSADLYLFVKDKDVINMAKQRHQQQQQEYHSQQQFLNNDPVSKLDPEHVVTNPNDKLYLFPDSQHCINNFDLEAYLKTNDKTKFCDQHCFDVKKEENKSLPLHSGSDDNDGVLSLSGALHYYRNFVHSFIAQLHYEDIIEEDLHFKLNIEVSKLQIEKLRKFTESEDEREASRAIQDTTYILQNMFRQSDYYKPDSNWDKIMYFYSSLNFSQYTFVILVLATCLFIMVLHSYRIRRFTYKNLIGALILVVFVTSVINNHMILNQKKQILRDLKLKEKIPDECFATNNIEINNENNKPKKHNLFSSIYSRIKNYVSHSPTSKACVEYNEALYINSYQSNIVETITFTFFESIRPIALSFGEFINQFHVALVKDLSFYQAIPLIILVTIVTVPLVIYLFSFIFLLLFNYEFNFFHLISLKKTPQSKNKSDSKEIDKIKLAMITQKKEMAKALEMIKRENQKILISYQKEEVAAIGMRENQKMVRLESLSSSISSSEGPAADDEEEFNVESAQNMSQVLDKTLETLIDNINNKESEYNQQVSQLMYENEILKQNLREKSHQKQLEEEQQRMKERLVQTLKSSIEVKSIEQSPTLLSSTRMSSNMCAAPLAPLDVNVDHSNNNQRRLSSFSPNIIRINRSEIDFTEIKSPNRPNKHKQVTASASQTTEKYLLRKPTSVLIDSIESSTERIFQNGSSASLEDSLKSSCQLNGINGAGDDDDDDDDEDIYVILEDK